jgi:branched-chain amino acid transport system ATP-binding protein
MIADAFLDIRNVTRNFAALVAIDDVSLTMQQGEIVALIGPNGAGKTTLFNLLTGQLRPTRGRVHLRGERIDHLPPNLRARRGMGRTFQIARPFLSMTTRENVMVGAFLRHRNYAVAYARADSVLEDVGLADRAGVPASELTLIERRRLEVARALALDPSLILLDEVMAGLNATEVDYVINLIQRLNADGMTFLLIEHNLKVVRSFSGRVIVLDRGRKIAEGAADDVFGQPEVVRAYLGNRT